MEKIELLDYHQSQMDVIHADKERLKQQGFVKGYQDVYPDVYKRIYDKEVAYIRGHVSLKLMAILYDVVIVYIPPLSQKQLEHRFCLSIWDEFISLCQHGIVIPIIGKAENYTASHFDALFIDLPTKPYSLWARGLGLLDAFGMSDTLRIAKDVLPIEQIANEDVIFQKWAKRYDNRDEAFVKTRIKEDAAVQFADLCIFGCRNEAESLLSLSPRKIYENMRLLNEVRTYPILFGLESQANFDKSKLSKLSTMPIRPQIRIPQALPETELSILYEGIGIDVDNISVEDIINFHNDGLGVKLRTALSDFNNYCNYKIGHSEPVDLTQVYSRASAFQNELTHAINNLNNHNYYAKLDKGEDIVKKVLQIGAITAGAVVATLPDTAQVISVGSLTAGVALGFISEFPESIANVITKFAAQGLYSKFVANMWSAKKTISRR